MHAGDAADDANGIITGITAYLSVRFLVRYFQTRTVTPFGIYCLLAGLASILRFSIG